MAPSALPAALLTPAASPEQRTRDLLRFITCGSVDDGKSTLIGRLLFDTKQLFDDQLSALDRDSRQSGTNGAELDLALALDGLAAEREQGITIDVAYRFFSTARRSFIVADTPGHEQYTRNMATGASNAEAAILLVDARKGLSTQTRRHSLLVSTLGIRHVVLAVNKMDLVDFSEEAFGAIVAEYRDFAAGLGFADIACIPMAARAGDNVTEASDRMPWYAGPTLLTHLETIEPDGARPDRPFRFPVQWVNRPNADFRGFAGLVSGGSVRVGQSVVVQPSGETTRIARIVTYDGDLDVAPAGSSVTLTLTDEVDVSRGSMIAPAETPAPLASGVTIRLFWMTRAPLREGAAYLAKIGTTTVPARVARIGAKIDLGTLEGLPAESLEANDLGEVTLAFDRPVALDPYRDNRETGSLILIDRESFDTVGMGLVLTAVTGAAQHVTAGDAPGWSPDLQRWLPDPFSASWRSAIKTATWRIAGTLLTVLGAWWLTGDLRIALLLGSFELIVKFVLQFGHERLWSHIGLGLRVTPSPAAAQRPGRGCS